MHTFAADDAGFPTLADALPAVMHPDTKVPEKSTVTEHVLARLIVLDRARSEGSWLHMKPSHFLVLWQSNASLI